MIDISKLDDPKWYVLHTFTGYEAMAVDNLNKCIAKNNLQDYILEVKIPMETVIEEKNGKKRAVERKLFPCYILIKMRYTDSLWHTIVNSRGVTGFVGPQGRPLPLTDEEVKKMKLEPIVIDIKVEVGQKVKISGGAFDNFAGAVLSVDAENQKCKVEVEMFGRATPIDVDFSQIEILDI
ncbi:MAG: transcription termination/antitermination factor NusG [Clostridia bacterium]|nr:transcription termination/antitermination factor NusG [Clostridia bacterium]